MLRRILNFMLANCLWVYLIVTVIAGFTWGFAEGLIAIGLTWIAIAILRNLFLTNDMLTKTSEEISNRMNMGDKKNIFSTWSVVDDTRETYSPFGEESVNAATWGQEKLNERLYDPIYHDLPGSAWHSRNRTTDD